MNKITSFLRLKKVAYWELFAIFTLYFSHITYFNHTLYQFSLWILAPTAFLLCFLNTKTISNNRYIRLTLILFIWCSITAFGAIDYGLAKSEIQRIWGVFIYCYIMATISRKPRLALWGFGSYIALLISSIIYAQNNILETMLAANSRLNDEKLNANFFGYQFISTTFVIFLYGDLLAGSYRKIARISFFLLIPLSFLVAILTASRQILILQIPLFLYLLYRRYWKMANMKNVFAIIMVLGIFSYIKWGADVYNNSYLKERSETNIKEDSRTRLFQSAIIVGLQNPFFGVGPGCYRISDAINNPNQGFSHCSYTELLANSGLIGFIIYCYLIIYFILQCSKAKQKHIKEAYLFWVYGIIYLIDNFFYVFYLDPTLLPFFIGVCTYSKIYFIKKTHNEEKSITSIWNASGGHKNGALSKRIPKAYQ